MSLLDEVRPENPMRGQTTPAATPKRAQMLARFKEAALYADLVTFDLFDTLLRRRCGEPDAVFHLMAERFRSIAPELSDSFVASRIAAETRARAEARRQGASEITLDDIYSELATTSPSGWSSHAAQLSAMERDAEDAVLEADPDVEAVFRDLVGAGVRVALVSDMYLPSAWLETVLAGAGITGHERLFLSNACGAAKADGTMWDVVRKGLSLPDAARIVHLGDHPEADGRTAQAAGIEAYILPKEVGGRTGATGSRSSADRLGWLCLPGDETIETEVERYWRSVGTRIVLPAALGLSAFIRSVAKRFATDRVYFLARDGLVFQKAFEATRASDETPSHYLWASRRCLNMAAIFDLDEVDLDFLTSGRHPLVPEAYLRRIDLELSPEVRTAIRRRFPDADVTVQGPEAKAQLRALFRDLSDAVLERSRHEREGLVAHLSAIGLFDGPAIVVDLGWHGSLQRSLMRLGLRLNGTAPDLIGVYLGTLEDRPHDVGGVPMRCFGWLFDDGLPPRARVETVGESFEVIELLFSAPEASIRYVRLEGETPRPARQAIDPSEAARIEASAFIHEAVARAAARTRSAARWISPETYQDVALARMRELLQHPSQEDVDRFSALDHAEGFGVADYHSLVGLPPPGFHPRALLRAYRASFWPRAFLRKVRLPARWAVQLVARVQERVWRLQSARSS